ncbi:MAG TPA: YqaJ viral recombinase family protein [Candidatus Kapabacteria bacterium]|nr:YqaJ viral recombinase family protein [Candidatus Kapabacteria bacterium]
MMTNKEWLAERQKGIGGSDIAALLGYNKWKNNIDVFLDKTKGNTIPDNPKMKAGRMMEDVIAKMFEEETGYKITKPEQMIYSHKEYDFLKASIDRFYINENNCVLECKNTENYLDEPEGSHFCQLQWYLGVLNIDYGAICYLQAGWKLNYFEYKRDDDFFKLMKNTAITFWNEHILTGIPPKLVRGEDVVKLFPVANNKLVEANNIDLSDYDHLRMLQKQQKELDNEIDLYKDKFKLRIGENEGLGFNGKPLITFKTSEVNSFDTTKFKMENPILYKQYLKQSNQRRLLIKEVI